MKKRLLAMALAVCILLTLFPINTHAFDMGESGCYMSINAGENVSAAIRDDGALYTWGYNGYGALGDGSKYNQLSPVKIMDNVCSVNSGCFSTFAIKDDQSLWSWGNNFFGNLGGGITATEQHTPIKVMEDVAAVSPGYNHTLAIKNDKSLWAWGSNSCGQLGDGSEEGSHISYDPVHVMDDVIAASAGNTYSMAITSDYTLWAWGSNSNGQFGNGTSGDSSPVPIKVAEEVVAVSCGNINYYTTIIRTDGSLWASGLNYWGELGDGTNTRSNTFVKIMDNVRSVSAGGSFTLALKDDGTLWGWGLNTDGQLGDGTTGMYNVPHMLMGNVVAFSAGRFHSIIKKDDGSIWTFGKNDNGQLGNGTTNDSNIPVRVFNDASEDDEPITTASVKYFCDWNLDNRSIVFDEQPSPYYFADAIDADTIDALVGRYTLVTMNSENVLEVANIQPVESKIGVVTDVIEGNGSQAVKSLQFDDGTYAVAGNPYISDDLIGKTVLYHLRAEEIVKFEVLEKKTGMLEAWDSTTRQATIDGEVYPTNYMSETTDIDLLVGKKVRFLTSSSSEYAPLFSIVFDPDASGTCGDNLTWLLEDGILTISGTGKMEDYDGDTSEPPWNMYCTNITSIDIKEGVTSIGMFAFSLLTNVRDISVGSSIETIGPYAFAPNTPTFKISFLGDAPIIDKTAFGENDIGVDIYFDKSQKGWNDQIEENYMNNNLAWIFSNDAREKLSAKDVWSFANSSDSKDFTEEDGYYITRNDYNRLLSNLNNVEKQFEYITMGYSWFNIAGETWFHPKWNGSCYAMSSIVALAKSKIINVSSIQNSAERLSDIDKDIKPVSKSVQSMLSYYMFQQNIPAMKDMEVAFVKQDALHSQINQIKNWMK